MKKVKPLVLFSLCVLFLCRMRPSCAQAYGQNIASAAFLQGTDAFKSGEWMSAVFMLRRAVSYPENCNSDTWYMLITAEMYAGEYKSAYQDCEMFLKDFPDSPYLSYIMYHKGRALFCLCEYERSVIQLSDFCHYYPDHEMYASALFWVAEAFFAAYNYSDAEILYSRVVSEFPDDAKAAAAQYRIETISQNAREEKLLYLLKETGEEYLAAKEEYERQLKLSGSDSAGEARRRIMELQHANAELQKKITLLEQEKNDLFARLDEEKQMNSTIKNENEDMVSSLKQKALWTQELMKARMPKDGK